MTECYDSPVGVEVSVSKKDCETAKKLNPSECALAQAAKKELHADGVIIGMSTSYIIKGKRALRFATPESVSREIISFDRHQDFAPGEYYLTPKAPTARLGTEQKNYRTNPNKTVKRKVHISARVRELPRGR